MTGPLAGPFVEEVRADLVPPAPWRCIVCEQTFPNAPALCDHIIATAGKPHQLTIGKEV